MSGLTIVEVLILNHPTNLTMQKKIKVTHVRLTQEIGMKEKGLLKIKHAQNTYSFMITTYAK